MSKTQTLLSKVVAAYETRKYRDGEAAANELLNESPNHPDGTVLKGACVAHFPDRRDEGHQILNRGIALNMRSRLAWQILGMVHKDERNYEAALKAFVQSSKLEDNVHVLSEIAQISLFLHKTHLAVDYSLKLVDIYGRYRRFWMQAALALDAAGRLDAAIDVLASYERAVRRVPPKEFDYSEVLMYHATLLSRSGRHDECVQFLKTHDAAIVDRFAFRELLAAQLTALGHFSDAQRHLSDLFSVNCENAAYLVALAKVSQIDLGASERRPADSSIVPSVTAPFASEYDFAPLSDYKTAVRFISGLTEKHPTSKLLARVPLDIIPAGNSQFETRLDAYIVDGLSRGIPSLFASLKALYKDSGKAQAIDRVITAHVDSLRTSKRFATDDYASEDIEAPTVLVWALYFYAHHVSKRGDHSKALDVINEALEHTPTLPELYLCKARVLKRLGSHKEAADVLIAAANLDGQDRFLNSKAVKYLLRAGLVNSAEALASKFTLDPAKPYEDLADMQALWFLVAEAKALEALGWYPLAIKRYVKVIAVFDTFHDDIYDFIYYNMRKFSMRALRDSLQYRDALRYHPAWLFAVTRLVSLYLSQNGAAHSLPYDHPEFPANAKSMFQRAQEKLNPPAAPAQPASASAPAEDTDSAPSTKSAKARAKAKQKSARKSKQDEEAAEKKAKEDADKKEAEEALSPTDLDPYGVELYKTDLVEAARSLVAQALKYTPRAPDAWAAAFTLAAHDKSLPDMLRALTHLRAVAPQDARMPDFAAQAEAARSAGAGASVPSELHALFHEIKI